MLGRSLPHNLTQHSRLGNDFILGFAVKCGHSYHGVSIILHYENVGSDIESDAPLVLKRKRYLVPLY